MGGMAASYSSHLTSKEQVILEACSLIYANQNNTPYWAKSDATLPPVVLALPILIETETTKYYLA